MTNGRYFSNFYGGLIVGSSQYDRLLAKFTALKIELNLLGEVKWSKVSEPYLGKYMALVNALYDEMSDGHLKIRIMFRHNIHAPASLTTEQIDGSYSLLYYQFIKHCFRFQHRPEDDPSAVLRLYFDDFPAKREQVQQFKGFIQGLSRSPEFLKGRVFLHPENITEVKSHDHVLLQLLDIVLGSMNFRLNDLHREIPDGERKRGKRTIAKEKLYKVILGRIRQKHPNFNIGTSTGAADISNRWHAPHRHWSFVPRQCTLDPSFKKSAAPSILH